LQHSKNCHKALPLSILMKLRSGSGEIYGTNV
jgi:hypothetical protein